MPQPHPTNLVWLDLEMSGLNPDKDVILEIATIVTDASLNIISEGPVFAIHQSDEILHQMDSWCTEHHAASGLTQRVKDSITTESEAERETLEFLSQFVLEKKSPMCGNSICQDRRFLWRYMPKLESFFHYRNLDVSSIKILAQLWHPEISAGLNKSSEHIAMQDIRDSINELRFYREHFFKF